MKAAKTKFAVVSMGDQPVCCLFWLVQSGVRRIYLLDRLANFSLRFLDNMHIVLNAPASVHLE